MMSHFYQPAGILQPALESAAPTRNVTRLRPAPSASCQLPTARLVDVAAAVSSPVGGSACAPPSHRLDLPLERSETAAAAAFLLPAASTSRWPAPARRRLSSPAAPRAGRLVAAAAAADTTPSATPTGPPLRNPPLPLPQPDQPLDPELLLLLQEPADSEAEPSPLQRHSSQQGQNLLGPSSDGWKPRQQQQQQQRPADAALLQRPVAPRIAATSSSSSGGGRRHRPAPSLLPASDESPSPPSQGPSTAFPRWAWSRPASQAGQQQGPASSPAPSHTPAGTADAGGAAVVAPTGPASARGGDAATQQQLANRKLFSDASRSASLAEEPGSSGDAGQRQRRVPSGDAPAALFSDDDPRVAAAYDNLPVTVTGRAPPAPLLSYNELTRRPLKMPPLLLRNAVAAFQLGRPTPIQGHVIPAVMQGRDVLAVSCTGSGKTLAYLLPLLAQLMGRTRLGSKNFAHPEALVLVPTRELAEQVYADVQLLLRGSHLKAMVVHGGVSMAEQVLAIRGRFRRSGGGVDLIVATPGRLLQLVEQRRAVRLGRLGLLVVDEADRMMELGMWPDIRRLLSRPGLPTARQTVLVAASTQTQTHGSAASPAPLASTNREAQSGSGSASGSGSGSNSGSGLKAAAAELLRDWLAVEVGDGSGTSAVVRQHVELVSHEDKLTRLTELLAPAAASGVAARPPPAAAAAAAAAAARSLAPGGGGSPHLAPAPVPPPGSPSVVFTRNLVRAEEVARHLAGKGVSVALLHRDLSQDQRDEALQCFRFGVTSVLVATALASRGLNFPDVAHVINYDVPESASVYMHQVGRTGRGGRPGLATTLITRSNRPSAPWLLDSLRRSGSPVPSWLEDLAAEAHAKGAALAAAARRKAAAAAAAAAAGAGEDADGGRSPPRQQRTVVALDDPAAAGSVRFGSYLGRQRSGSAAGGGGAAAPSAPGTAGSAGALEGSVLAAAPTLPSQPDAQQPVVVDRRHDAEYWQAVFEAAISQPLQQQQEQQERQQGRQRQGRAAAGAGAGEKGEGGSRGGRVGVGAAAAAGPPGRGRRGRLVYSDAGVQMEARPGEGLTVGPGEAGRGRRR
ncbi:hypothetical protein PLESTB_001772900 [Pleodorina starrii]|uniref:Uncharacterized protein n=1 Tax=Pleodorina starrii TaxID=330485 RepID=A0A9W6BZR8_9CHLO|nr:hypothetical protein PLESTM_000825200 [Pleodorina starrii]GLC61586.1 hypothetical protein PLESTB_001772900 [Pleodorina starrii]GLC76982.1 hypothetical protein PLESTF_001863400 [Pleodorina starrii]